MASRPIKPLQVPVGFWLRDDVREALTTRNIGALFRLVRRHTGSSQTQIGIAVDMEQGYVSKLMNDLKTIRAIDVLDRISTGLGMPDSCRLLFGLAPRGQARPAYIARDEAAELVEPPSAIFVRSSDKWNHGSTDALAKFFSDRRALTADTAQRLAHEWRVVDPPQVVEMKAGRRIGARLAQVVTERADVLRHMDDFLGGGDMHDLVRRELQTTLDMVRGAAYTEKTGQLLLASVGELAQLAGWVASDAGLHAQAERYYLGGVTAAHAAKDEPLAGHLLSSLGYQVANIGDPREAVLLASTAYRGAGPTATPTARAMLMERVAWANARFGDAKATEAALGKVDEAFAESNPANDPAWAYWLNREEIDVMAGRCLTQHRRPERAIELLTQAVNRYDDTHARELALYLTWLAEAHIYADNIEEAAANVTRALRLSAGVTSVRSSERIRLVRGLLVPYHGNSAVDEFEEEVAEQT